MSTWSPIVVYPCDRGMANGPQGLHHFQASPNGVVVCIYCGAQPPPRPIKVTYESGAA